MNYWLGVIGTWIFADGFASLWAYTGNGSKETFWRNHSLRILRCVLGLIIIAIGYINV